MKETVIIIFILFLVIAGNIGIQTYLGNSIERLISKLDILKEETIKNKDFNELEEFISDINSNWKKDKKIWGTIADHNHIDKIETGLISIQAKINSNQDIDLIAEIDKSIFLLADTKEKNALKLKNIF